MNKDLERIIVELEGISARMLATTCWEQDGEFGELCSSQRMLAAQLMNRRDLDASACERIRAVIVAGDGLMAQILAMRHSVADAIAEAERQHCFAREASGTVHRQTCARQFNMEA